MRIVTVKFFGGAVRFSVREKSPVKTGALTVRGTVRAVRFYGAADVFYGGFSP